MLREIKNNNPGNVRYNPVNNWVGQIGMDYRGFVIFDSLYNGVRAMVKIIVNDINKGTNTIRQLIYEYAPPNENNTGNYVATICDMTGLDANQDLTDYHNGIINVVYCMILVESGEAVPMALVVEVYDDVIDNVQQPPVYASKSSLLIPAAVAAGVLIYLNN